jgi:hypothetical protein
MRPIIGPLEKLLGGQVLERFFFAGEQGVESRDRERLADRLLGACRS